MLFPLSALQNWPTPNYANPERRGPAATIVVSVLLALVTVILVVRIYTRVRISRGFGLDDVLIIFAYVWSSWLRMSSGPAADQQQTDTHCGLCRALVRRHVEVWLGHSRLGRPNRVDQAKSAVQVGHHLRRLSSISSC